MTGIYIITNTITKEVYIGQSVNIANRFNQHRNNMYSSKYALYRDMRAYGINIFTFEVLEECSKSSLDKEEMKWISHYYKNGYSLYNIVGNPKKEANYAKKRRGNKKSSKRYKR